MKIIFATGNEGKLREVRKLFEDFDVEILSLKDLKDTTEIIEDADTFEGNSLIKVETIFGKYGIPCIGDDSGLIVEQLNGMPGVHSARYAGENCNYEDNNLKLLHELKGYPEPHLARFICCAGYYDGRTKITAEGELRGKIINEFRGSNGFGYDPLFVPEGYSITLAEMSPEEKNKISHRARAFQKLKRELIDRQLL